MDDTAVLGRAHHRPMKQVGALLAAAIAACLAAGCSSGSSGSSWPSSLASSALASNSQLAFARCMRAHGVSDYPDSGALLGSRPDLDPNNPTYQAARQACQSLLPAHPAHQQTQNSANGLKFSRCMRNHGITNFPDPDPNGGPNGHGGVDLRGLGIDLSSPQFQSAQQACRRYLSGAKDGSR